MQALELGLQTGLQVDHEAALAHQPAVGFGQHRAAAGGQQQAFAGQQAGQGRGFALAEPGFADMFEDGADAGPGLLLDVMVGIDETQAETVGQAATDRGLARAHRADQDEVGGGIHGPGC